MPIVPDESHQHYAQCNKVDSWLSERSLDVFGPDVIVHLTFDERYNRSCSNIRSPIYQAVYAKQERHTWVVKETTFESRTTGSSASRRIGYIISVLG